MKHNIPFKELSEDTIRFDVVFKSRFALERAKKLLAKHGHIIKNESHTVNGYEIQGRI